MSHMKHVQCPNCSHRFESDLSGPEAQVVCPNCGQSIVPTDLAATVMTSDTPKKQPEPTSTKSKPSGGPNTAQIIAVLLCVAFFISGVASCTKSMDDSFSPKYEYSNRFKSDNAYGASANALEYIAKHIPATGPAPWFICGLLCWLIASVEGLRRTVAQKNQRNGD